MSRKPIEDGFKELPRNGRTPKQHAEKLHALRRRYNNETLGTCCMPGCSDMAEEGKRMCKADNARVNERNRNRRLLKKQKTQI